MKPFVKGAAFSLAVACLVLSACSKMQAPSQLPEAVMSRGADVITKAPLEKLHTYNKFDNTFTCCVQVAGAKEPARMKAVWYYTGGAKPQSFDSTEIRVEGTRWIAFTLSHAGRGWPYGPYRVDLYRDGAFAQSVPFDVQPTYKDSEMSELVLSGGVNDYYYPTRPASVFPQTTAPVYACMYLNEPKRPRVYQAVWHQLLPGRDEAMNVAEITHGDSGWIAFSLLPNAPLPPGKYYVQLSVDGTPYRRADFSVR